MLRQTSHLYVFEMNEWSYVFCFCIYIYNYIFFLHKMEKKIKNEKPTFTKCYGFVYLACCVSVI